METVPELQPLEIIHCDSCDNHGELFDVPHHQAGNPKVWKYCARCKAVHEKEAAVLHGLQELAKTHPEAVDTPDIAGKIRAGMSVEDVKSELDRNRQPLLEAEIV